MDRAVPHGWFSALRSVDLRRGRAVGFQAMGQHFAAWRTLRGEVHVVDAHCPHQGAALADGRVAADGLACPFHEWRFQGDGRCVHIPNAQDRPIPETARVGAYPCRDAYGAIWFYAGAGEPPAFPDCPEYGRHDYTGTSAIHIEVPGHPLAPLENALDLYHLGPVHRKPFDGGEVEILEDAERRFVFTNHLSFSAFGRTLRARNEVTIYDGSIQTGLIYFGDTQMARWMMIATPIDDTRLAIINSVTVKRAPFSRWLPRDPIAFALRRSILRGVRLDERIWSRQRRDVGQVVVPADRHAERFRQHYARMVERDHRGAPLRTRASTCHPASRWARVDPQIRRSRPSQ